MSTTATTLYSLVICPHRVFLDAHGDPTEKVPASAFLEMLWQSGRDHEDRVIATLDIVDAKTTDDVDRRIEDTLRLMREGHAWIYHGLFRVGDLVGEPDLLERVETPSTLGDHSYIPVDVKAGRAFEDRKVPTPKEQYQIQLSAYAEMLEAAQGVRPSIGRIIDRSGEPQTIDLAAYRSTYEERRAQLRRIVAKEETTGPGWNSAACPQCLWQEHCWKDLQARDDLTTVAGIGAGRRDGLWQIGVRTASELAKTSPEQLQQAKGVGATFAVAWPRQARAQKSGVPEFLAPWTPPVVDFEVSYDIEDYTPDDYVYLHGLLVREPTAKRYGSEGFTDADFGAFDPVCMTAGETEEDAWRAFLTCIEAYERRGSYAVYVYSHHEKTKLKELVAKYGGGETIDAFTTRFVDLMPAVAKSVILPTDGRGLKTIAQWIGFNWRDEDPGGAQSIAWWKEYIDDPAAKSALRDRVIAYNEDDVRATFVVRDWLERFSSTPTK